MKTTYKTSGTCATSIDLDVEDGIVKSVKFISGCNGNLKGIASLVSGMKVEDVISRLEGITCGSNPNSCPDQLARALKEITA